MNLGSQSCVQENCAKRRKGSVFVAKQVENSWRVTWQYKRKERLDRRRLAQRVLWKDSRVMESCFRVPLILLRKQKEAGWGFSVKENKRHDKVIKLNKYGRSKNTPLSPIQLLFLLLLIKPSRVKTQLQKLFWTMKWYNPIKIKPYNPTPTSIFLSWVYQHLPLSSSPHFSLLYALFPLRVK